MCLVHVAAGLHSGGVADFWRDIYWATVIAHGERFPLSGPPINNFFELGPWWFYLLALPLGLFSRIAAAAVFVQLLASAKYFLAWRLGLRLVDARFAVAFAVSMAIAGWSTAAFWFPSHPALIETTLFLLAFAAWRCRIRLSLGNAILYGLASAACVHAHPTTASYVAIGGLMLLYRYRSWRAVGLMSVAALIVVLSLLPPWFDTSTAVPNINVTLATYVSRDIGVDWLRRIPALLNALLFGGAGLGFLIMTKWSAATATLAWWIYCACLALVAAGVLFFRPQRASLRLGFAIALALVVGQVMFLALLRPFTSIWMVPSCLPPLAFAIATGWYGWFVAASRAQRVAGIGAFVLYAGLVVAPFGLFLRDLRTIREGNANTLFNISDATTRYTTANIAFSNVREIDAIAAALCEPATLHGRLGALMEGTSASAIRNACGAWPDLRFSGEQTPGRHLAGLTTAAAAAIGIRPDRSVRGMAFYSQLEPIAPKLGTGLAGLRRMEVARRPPDESPAAPTSIDFDTGARDVVVLTNRYPLFAALTIRHAVANGAPATALYGDGKMFAYRCASCADSSRAHWHIDLNGVAANLDIVALLAAPVSNSTNSD
jgi:hypothetical protein